VSFRFFIRFEGEVRCRFGAGRVADGGSLLRRSGWRGGEID
jgi:hypothetical protein